MAEQAETGLPSHVAIIMDGNGRWAAKRSLPRAEGHRRGVETIRRIVRHAAERGIAYLTLFSFSSENWSRPEQEVNDLIGLAKRFVQKDLAALHANNVRMKVIGDRGGLSDDILALIDHAETTTADNSGLNLIVAFNYGARNEIARAAKKLALDCLQGRVELDQIGPENISERLDTADIPDPDLLIRTSGELRISNFLLWQAAYAEFFFSPVFWPDFREDEFDSALAEYAKRDRRFGSVAHAS